MGRKAMLLQNLCFWGAKTMVSHAETYGFDE